MKKVLGVLFVIVGLLWVVNSGYKHFGFSRTFGTEQYSLSQDKDNTATSTESTGKTSSTPRKEEFKVTHIQTPQSVKAVYMSSWVAGAPSIRQGMVKMIETTELNAIVIDVKDNTGVLTWDGRAKDIMQFVDELHKKNIYVIARIAAFQDPAYVKAHPEQAVQSKSTGGLWKDHKGVPWVDTGSRDMWDYIYEVSKKSYDIGFDEVNLDYIRFPTDGSLSDMVFPVSGARAVTDKVGIVGDFYRYITDRLRKEGIPTSADIFGIVLTTNADVPVLGQDPHVALETFDYVAPMIYPSHFYAGTAGYQNPSAHPGEIIAYSMKKALVIADEVASSTGKTTSSIRAKFRPWYQDFDMGSTYTAEMVRAQIEAGNELGVDSWMLWDPANKYTPPALKSE